MNKSPAFLFYASDFYSSCALLTYEQKGKFIDLLCLQFISGHFSQQQFEKIAQGDQEIYDLFDVDEDGKYYNKRLETEKVKREEYSASRSKNRNAKAKASNTSRTYVEHMSNICESYVKHMENGNENENINVNVNVNRDEDIDYLQNDNKPISNLTGAQAEKRRLEEAFEEFWRLYPKKKSKADAEKAWFKIKPSEARCKEINEAIKRLSDSDDWSRESGKFIPYPATWLNRGGWDDAVRVDFTAAREREPYCAALDDTPLPF